MPVLAKVDQPAALCALLAKPKTVASAEDDDRTSLTQVAGNDFAGSSDL